ncbi:MAG TPA: hypothetical protein VFM18_17905 [Methanosarcina sp.]|nr:hypothetical protein [Methanosarcina sp.]
MAHSRLHIICGNCGSNKDFEFEIDPNGHDYGEGGFRPAVFISCMNCGTLHDLSDHVKERE